jgi:tRNA (cytidine/uridine-2'-O-)-methyltransferase
MVAGLGRLRFFDSDPEGCRSPAFYCRSPPLPTPPFNIVLVEPEIPPNTGSIARLCGATDTILHLVHPLGFKIDDKHLKRAGLDYWPEVKIVNWSNLEEFIAAQDELRLHFLSKKVKRLYTEVRFRPGDFLIFGKETKGLPEEILDLYADRCCAIPMSNPRIRSINLAQAAAVVLYEAIRQSEDREQRTEDRKSRPGFQFIP